MRNKLLILFLLVASTAARAQVFTVDTIAYHGNPNNRINLLIMGDGYTSGELSTFRTDAQSVANYFFSVPPYSLYANFFNVFGIEVVSNESGTDHPETAPDCVIGAQPITAVDNYLETTFDYGGTHRCIFSNQNALVYSIANTNFPLYDFINVIVNTSYYGGCAGGIAYTSMNSASPEVFVHEFGHMFGDLSDEYEYSDPCSAGNTQYINVTQETNPSLIVWKNWLTTAPIPTPSGTNCSLIGLYEGAQYCSTNWYRPKCNCKMRSLNQPLCEVCTEQLIYKVSTMVNYIESHSPSNATTVPLCKNSTLNFSAGILNSTTNTVRSQWLVDNVVAVNNSANFTLNPSSLSTGIHQVKLIAYDTTLQAKKTLTPYQLTWSVNVLAAPAATATSNGTTFCTGQTLNLSASGTGTFSWAGPNAYSSPSQNPSLSNLTASQSGTYTVTATNSCGTSSSSVVVSVSSSVNANITAQGPLNFCSGNSVVLDAGANASNSYQWYNNSGLIPGAGSHDFTAFQSGDYTVAVTITGTTCSATSLPVTVTVNPSPVADITTTDTTVFCQGGSATLQAQTGAGYSYQWFRGNQLLVSSPSSQYNASASGNYSIVATLGSCRDTSGIIGIVVNPNPSNTITIQGDTVFCIGDQVDLSVPSCATCTYQWQKDLVDIHGAIAESYAASEHGYYRVQIINTLTSCSSISRDVFVDVHNMPLAAISADGPAFFCDGDSVELSVASGPSYSFAWYLDAQPLSGSTSPNLTAKTPGAYTVIISDLVCSTQSDPFQVTVNPVPQVSIDALPDTMCIYNSQIALHGSPAGGLFSGSGVVDSSFSPVLAGNGLHAISYIYSDSNGCGDLSSDSIFVDICLGTATLTEFTDFSLFPNPASGFVAIRFYTDHASEVYFTLRDMTGRIVEQFNRGSSASGENSVILNTHSRAPGVYFVEMKSGGRALTKKLVVTN